MSRLIVAALGALLLGLPVVAQAQSSTPTPVKESGNPINDQGSNYNYRSNITTITPSVPGLNLEVLEFADRLVLTNHTGKTITVYGYQGETYARVLADGTVEVNTHSPAYYLNQNFYGDVNVPSSASPGATPDWTVIDRTGQLEWHDHRIHWMSRRCPRRSRTGASAPRSSTGRCRSRSEQHRGPLMASCFGFPRKAPRPLSPRSWRWSCSCSRDSRSCSSYADADERAGRAARTRQRARRQARPAGLTVR
jgi:hypothetical protein